MTNEQLIDFAMKLQDNLTSKQTQLINCNKEFREKLNIIEAKLDDSKKWNETIQSKVIIAKKTSATLSTNHKKLNDRKIEMERNMHRLQQYSRRECIEIAEVPNSITDDLLKEHIILIFEKLGVLIEGTVYIYRYIFNLFVILLYIHKASEKKKNICNLNKFCVFFYSYIFQCTH